MEINKAQKVGKKLVSDVQNVDREHDKTLIESCFEDFANGDSYLEEEDMKHQFGEYGWGSLN